MDVVETQPIRIEIQRPSFPISNESPTTNPHLAGPPSHSQPMVFERAWAAGLSVLILATFPIWVPWPTTAAGFPRVTWFKLPDAPLLVTAADIAATGLLLASLVVLMWKGAPRVCWWLVAAALGVSILLDQQRLQPWAFQSLLYAFIFAAIPRREGRRWITAIAVSIYFYSAAGKLDYQFVHTVGNQMVQTIARPLGGIDETLATKLSFLLPISELMIATLIAFPTSRRIGGVLAMAMHITLLGLLGPLSLDHSLGVLAWNAVLAVQSWILFVKIPEQMEDSDSVPISLRSKLLRIVVRSIIALALLMPLFERAGYWDHWTSWALYSPHNSRAEIQIHRTAIDQLPETARDYLVDDDGDRWSDLDIERWSLDRRMVPIYPQGRYQLAFAISLAQQSELGSAIRVRTQSVSDRWTGRRQESYLIGVNAMEKEMNRYWLRGGF